jgi:hypothetical protein
LDLAVRDPDDGAIAALIERIVVRSRIPGRAQRDDLRRELATHFEEASRSPEAAEAVRRFGAESLVGESLRHVYRWDYAGWYVAKVAATLAASIAAALLIQVVVNLRVERQTDVWRFAPGFSRAVGVSVVVVLGLVAVSEASRQPFHRARAAMAVGAYAAVCLVVRLFFLPAAGGLITATILVGIGHLCSRLDRWPPRLLVLVSTFALALYVNHLLLSVAFGPIRALIAGAILGAVWSSSVVILHHIDSAFARRFEPARTHEI